MDFSHGCDRIANAPRRINISKCKFTYQDIQYEVVIKKVKSHNNLKICYGDLNSNGEFNKKIVIKTYEPNDLFDFNQGFYDELVDEIDNHSKIESKIGYSNYFSHMLFHYWTDTYIGIIFDDFGTTLESIDLFDYSLKSKILIILQLIKQINFLQENEIYHGDLKPANVCITSDGQAVLIDFGIGYLKDFYSNTIYNTTITSGSPEYMGIHLNYLSKKQYPKELFDKSQHFAISGLIFGILINNPKLYFSKCLNVLNLLKDPNENLRHLNFTNRFKYFNEKFSTIICEFIEEELEKNPSLTQFKPILLNMFEYDYKKRSSLNLIIEQIEQINI